MTYPPVIVVDKDDIEIGNVMLAEVWKKGLYHRISRVMVEDVSGKVLLQRRSPEMGLYPNRWDCSAGGHVDEGMTYLGAAKQEAAEEIGLEEATLEEIGYFFLRAEFEGRKMYNFNRLYRLRVDVTDFTVEEHEVAAVAWFTKEELERMAAEDPQQLSAGLRYVINNYYHSSLYAGVQ
ncbi:MAG TPA: NUDIX domain-containing protein [Candidatus Saccharimonadales bacterium]|nr:NUDIX domain-containing protein [Candidatus Saccharimonadales bacterium]